jgi:hypothetical protein
MPDGKVLLVDNKLRGPVIVEVVDHDSRCRGTGPNIATISSEPFETSSRSIIPASVTGARGRGVTFWLDASSSDEGSRPPPYAPGHIVIKTHTDVIGQH